MSDFQVYESEIVKSRHSDMSGFIDMVANNPPQQDVFVNEFTWNYERYNVFGLLSTTPDVYDLYCELNAIVYDFLDDQKVDTTQVWMQSWLNYHNPSELLDWHDHKWPYHGYISIRPQNTTTLFEDINILNEVGNVYIGRGNRKHSVQLNSDQLFEEKRITIGFDLDINVSRISNNIGLIPFPRIKYK